MPVLLIVLFLILPVAAAAQSSRSGTSGTPTLPSIGLPLADIGLPLGVPERPKADKPGDNKSMGRIDRDDRDDRRGPPSRRPRGDDRRGRNQSRTVYVVPAYPTWNYPVPEPAPAPPAQVAQPEPAPTPEPEPIRPTGTLALEVDLPGSAQVFVDDYYVGTINDVGRELTLEAGPHNVQLRAAGYETLNVNVKIDEGRTITYRGALQRAPGQAAPPVASAAPVKKTPIYAIPGCYLGNVPPQEAVLPAGCDPSKAITIKP